MPLEQPSDLQRRIETGLDGGLRAPTNYMWNLTIERQLPAGLVVQASYIGRAGRNLLAQRDPVTPNNLRDPKSGAGLLYGRHSPRKAAATGAFRCGSETGFLR